MAAEYGQTIRGKEVDVNLVANGLTKRNEFIVGKQYCRRLWSRRMRNPREQKRGEASGGSKVAKPGTALSTLARVPELFSGIPVQFNGIQPTRFAGI